MMELPLQESFDRSCRLCAEEQDVTILLFGEEAEAMLLRSKLNKYLLLEIEEDDKLPKNICLDCCSKLNTVCDFIEKTRKAQDILVSRSFMLEQMSPKLQIKSIQSLAPIKQEPICYNDDENQVTEMEINVDPMMILQNSESISSPCGYEQNPEDEDYNNISYLHGLSGENVTLKLIKRGEAPTDENNDEMQHNDDKSLVADTGIKPFSCHICKRSYLTDLALKNHSWNHSTTEKSKRGFKCYYCFEPFDFRVDLNAHMKSHKTLTTCKTCKRVFRSAENLRKHMATHVNNNAYICKVCGRSYNNKSNLKTHSVTHSNDRPFKCHLCKKKFKRNQDLKFHINQHTGAKPYKCPFCDKCFASSGNCYSHRNRMHPGRSIPKQRKSLIKTVMEAKAQIKSNQEASNKPEIKFQCTLCQHSFTKKDNYLYHMYQHTGEKPFHCTYCPNETFFSRKGLLLHHSKIHGDINNTSDVVPTKD